jgi:hypothetical protein
MKKSELPDCFMRDLRGSIFADPTPETVRAVLADRMSWVASYNDLILRRTTTTGKTEGLIFLPFGDISYGIVYETSRRVTLVRRFREEGDGLVFTDDGGGIPFAMRLRNLGSIDDAVNEVDLFLRHELQVYDPCKWQPLGSDCLGWSEDDIERIGSRASIWTPDKTETAANHGRQATASPSPAT